MSDSFIPITDHEFFKRLQSFGGWQRVLDPSYNPTEELYQLFELAGYERSKLDRRRQKDGKPERDAWIESIAERLHYSWRVSVERITFIPTDWAGVPGHTPGVAWHQYPGFEEWEGISETMKRLSIEEIEIDGFIDANSQRFPPLVLKNLR